MKFLLSVCVLLVCSSCGKKELDRAPEPDWFSERAEQTGLTFTHVNGMSGKFHYAEIIGSGVALFDMDNDGDLDVFLVQSTGGSRLFRNDLANGRLSFVDVTERSGIVSGGYGMGVAAGDFDNDGCVDLYLTNLGKNQLFHNNCDGTFTDVSARSGTAGTADDWSVSAAFVDYDRDGWLDLFVTHYLTWSADKSTPCFSASGRRDYCSPNVYQPQMSRLYRNNHDGTFTDVTERAGLSREFGPALGVATADFNGDGWVDIYVANDGQPNQLWINRHDGTFRNTALLAGAALSANGKPKGSMGVDAGDVDNDGHDDLFMTELTGEGANFFVNDGTGVFEDRSVPSGLAALTIGQTGFGTAWIDFDNDGRLDLLTANGAVQTIESLARVNDPFPLHQPKRLFRNVDHRRFEDVSAVAGAVFRLSEVGRGAAFGDIDNDGDTDVVVSNNNGSVRLLMNNVGNRNHWVGLRLVRSVGLPPSPKATADHRSFSGGGQADQGPPRGGHYVRDALGARVQITLPDGQSIFRHSRSDGSYASANDPRVLAGLGDSAGPVDVRVMWPDGAVDTWRSVPIDRYSTLQQGGSK